ncbi:MAG: hypothetical protein OEW83_08175 [Acidimicrobiia bacterium]|nr:hypothetical protein [Acidimicrobiia bacterium]
MTSETARAPASEDEMGTHPSRLVRPFVLAAPLMILVLLPALLYGQRSRDVAAEADRALVDSFAPTADDTAVALDPEMLCDPSSAATLTTTFTEIDVDGDNHKSSVTGLGFDTVTVDLKGWIDEPSGPNMDDIIIRLERSGGGWCVADVKTLVTESD